jgi:hypothetical protein
VKRLFTLVLLSLSAVVLLGVTSTAATQFVRWDIINVTVVSGVPTLTAGGKATAIARDGSKITLTGSGTFVFPSTIGSTVVNGGGTWKTFSSSGTLTGQGTYAVTNYLNFRFATGFIPPTFDDEIAERDDAHSGLAHLRISFSDGSKGVLIISCNLPGGELPNRFEGITVSKEAVDYWNRTDPVAGVNANRNTFHTIP